jgi:hypothetical protein
MLGGGRGVVGMDETRVEPFFFLRVSYRSISFCFPLLYSLFVSIYPRNSDQEFHSRVRVITPPSRAVACLVSGTPNVVRQRVDGLERTSVSPLGVARWWAG